jgi:hypothetical protein
MATGDWRMKERDSVPEPDIETYFGIVGDGPWLLAHQTEWSVAEHPGKAMLWAYDAYPCLLGEATWTAIKRHHPGVFVEYHATRNLFRFSEMEHEPLCGEPGSIVCRCPLVTFAYAAGIRMPEGQEDVAHAIAQTLVSTSK